jgi:hypothetical protein
VAPLLLRVLRILQGYLFSLSRSRLQNYDTSMQSSNRSSSTHQKCRAKTLVAKLSVVVLCSE